MMKSLHPHGEQDKHAVSSLFHSPIVYFNTHCVANAFGPNSSVPIFHVPLTLLYILAFVFLMKPKRAVVPVAQCGLNGKTVMLHRRVAYLANLL